MAVVCRETYQSRDTATTGGANTGVRKFFVYDTASPITSSLGVRILFGTSQSPDNLPNYGDQFPGAVSPFVAYDVSITSLGDQGNNDVWVVEWKYRDATEFGGGSQTQPEDVGFIEFSCAGTAVFDEQWRAVDAATLATLVASGGNYPFGANNASDADIGGTPIDIAGSPVSGPLRKTVRLSVSETRDTKPDMGYVMQFVGRRNNTPFAGAAKGLVVYAGINASRISPFKYRWSHEFVLDNYYHLVQVPYRNPDGTILLGTSGGVDGKAEFVTYRQPFPDYANFSAISPYFAGAF